MRSPPLVAATRLRADDASAELVAHLTCKPPQGGIALLLGARPGQGSAFATRTVNEVRLSSAVENIELEPLDLESTARDHSLTDSVIALHAEPGCVPDDGEPDQGPDQGATPMWPTRVRRMIEMSLPAP